LTAAFDESGLVATVDFEYPIEPDEQAALILEIRTEALRTIRRHLEHEYRWAASGRTKKNRQLRFDLLRNETKDAELARRHGRSRIAVLRQRQALLKLRRRALMERNE
jgi:hypothetical protein